MSNRVYVADANGTTYLLKQVGWYAPDNLRPEGMKDATWEEERIATMWTADDQGGINDTFAGKLLPMYVMMQAERET